MTSWRPLLEQDIIRRYLVKCLVIFNHATNLKIETAVRSLEHTLLIKMRRPRRLLETLALLPACGRSFPVAVRLRSGHGSPWYAITVTLGVG